MFWTTSFNKIVRSHEALVLGILLGMMLGISLIIFSTIHVNVEHDIIAPAQSCGQELSSVKYINFSQFGKVKSLICSDGEHVKNF